MYWLLFKKSENFNYTLCSKSCIQMEKKCILYFTKIIRYSSASALLEKYLIKHGIYKIKKNSIQILLLLWFIY